MESTDSLAARIRSGYLEALAARPFEVLRGLDNEATPADAVRQARNRQVSLQTRDRILEAVVRAYRIGQRQLWGPVLLEILGPQLAEAAQQFHILAPLVDSEDLGQQLVLEVLSAAATVPIPEGAQWVEQRILRRAGFNVARWLHKQTLLVRAAVDPDSPVLGQEAYRLWLERGRIEDALEALERSYPDRREATPANALSVKDREVSVAIPAWGSLDPLRVTRSALLGLGFVLLLALGVHRIAAGDGRGLAFIALGIAGLVFLTRRGLPTAIWLGVALDGVFGFLGDSGYRGAELVVGLVGAGVALIPGQTTGTAAHVSPTLDEPHDPPVKLELPTPLFRVRPKRLTIRTLGRFEVASPEGDLTGQLSRRPVQEFLWLFLLARKLAAQGPISRPLLAEVLSPRIDSGEQGNRLRRRISDMQADLPKPLLECLVLKGREVDFSLDDCEVDVLRLASLRERVQAAGEIPPELVNESEATLTEIGFGKFLPGWEEIENRMTAAKGSAGDTIVEVRVAVSEDRAAIVLALTALYRAAGNPGRAIPLLVDVLNDNPEIEDVARALIAIYLNTGQDERAKVAKRKYLSHEEE